MFDCYLTFRSITRAQRAAAVLERAGIYQQLQRTPQALSDRGCGYALRVSNQSADAAVQELYRNQVPFERVYRRESGGYREMTM